MCSGMWLTIPNLLTLGADHHDAFHPDRTFEGPSTWPAAGCSAAPLSPIFWTADWLGFRRPVEGRPVFRPDRGQDSSELHLHRSGHRRRRSWWIVLLIFGRDLWILVLSAIALQFTGFRNLQPSLWGKASTFFQIMAAVAVMAARAYDNAGFSSISTALMWMVSRPGGC